MANFAKINSENLVIDMITVEDINCTNSQGIVEEAKGIQYLQQLFSESNVSWKQYCEQGTFRKNPAGLNSYYDEERDAFRAKDAPFSSWILNEETCRWEPPTPYPNDGNFYQWNEETQSWDAPE
jgi:hypothetical protein